MGANQGKTGTNKSNINRFNSNELNLKDVSKNGYNEKSFTLANSQIHSNLMIVLFDFIAPNNQQLSIKKNQIVRHLAYSQHKDWSKVEIIQSNDQQSIEEAGHGWVPTSYLAPYSNESLQIANNNPLGINTGIINAQGGQVIQANPMKLVPNTPHFTQGNEDANQIIPKANSFTNSSQHQALPQPPTVSAANTQLSLAHQQVYQSLLVYPWFHGLVSRQTGEHLLRSGITGCYLVRASESAPGQLSVTVRHSGRVYHYRISQDNNGLYYITDAHRFTNVAQLIEHHSHYADGLVCPLLYPASKRSHGDNSSVNGLSLDSRDHQLTSSEAGSAGHGPPFGPNMSTAGSGNDQFDGWEIDRSEIIMRHKLGWGQYGDVYEALWKRYNTRVAVKTVKQEVNINISEFLDEAAIMKNLRHPNLVQLLGVCTREPPFYLVTEYMPCGNLLNYLRNKNPIELTPPVLLYMAIQIASGMAYLEDSNLVHRDLAARNCLVGERNLIKVADFGLARYVAKNDTYTAKNGAKFPIKWTAPEGLATNTFSSKSDVWAFGVVLWELATYGQAPYPGLQLNQVYEFLEKGFRMERPHGCPENIHNIMIRCWAWISQQRPSFKDILVDLQQINDNLNIEAEVARELDKSALMTPQPTNQQMHPQMHQNLINQGVMMKMMPQQPQLQPTYHKNSMQNFQTTPQQLDPASLDMMLDANGVVPTQTPNPAIMHSLMVQQQQMATQQNHQRLPFPNSSQPGHMLGTGQQKAPFSQRQQLFQAPPPPPPIQGQIISRNNSLSNNSNSHLNGGQPFQPVMHFRDNSNHNINSGVAQHSSSGASSINGCNTRLNTSSNNHTSNNPSISGSISHLSSDHNSQRHGNKAQMNFKNHSATSQRKANAQSFVSLQKKKHSDHHNDHKKRHAKENEYYYETEEEDEDFVTSSDPDEEDIVESGYNNGGSQRMINSKMQNLTLATNYSSQSQHLAYQPQQNGPNFANIQAQDGCIDRSHHSSSPSICVGQDGNKHTTNKYNPFLHDKASNGSQQEHSNKTYDDYRYFPNRAGHYSDNYFESGHRAKASAKNGSQQSIGKGISPRSGSANHAIMMQKNNFNALARNSDAISTDDLSSDNNSGKGSNRFDKNSPLRSNIRSGLPIPPKSGISQKSTESPHIPPRIRSGSTDVRADDQPGIDPDTCSFPMPITMRQPTKVQSQREVRNREVDEYYYEAEPDSPTGFIENDRVTNKVDTPNLPPRINKSPIDPIINSSKETCTESLEGRRADMSGNGKVVQSSLEATTPEGHAREEEPVQASSIGYPLTAAPLPPTNNAKDDTNDYSSSTKNETDLSQTIPTANSNNNPFNVEDDVYQTPQNNNSQNGNSERAEAEGEKGHFVPSVTTASDKDHNALEQTYIWMDQVTEIRDQINRLMAKSDQEDAMLLSQKFEQFASQHTYGSRLVEKCPSSLLDRGEVEDFAFIVLQSDPREVQVKLQDFKHIFDQIFLELANMTNAMASLPDTRMSTQQKPLMTA